MKSFKPAWVISVLTVLCFQLPDGWADSTTNVMASRGDGVLTHAQFDAHVARIPEENRRQVLRDKTRLGEILDQLLIADQLASEAVAAGFDQDPLVKSRMELSAREELGRAWLTHYINSQPEADYEAMAREYWMVNKSQFMTQPEIDVSHILISNSERGDEEALLLAEQLAGSLKNNPAEFDDLVIQYSEDPSAKTNKGRYFGIKRGEMVKPFEEAAFAQSPGEISGPVKTMYGYHLIRLDANRPARQRSFDEVKQTLVRQMRSQHREELRSQYLTKLYADEIVIDQEDLERMVERQFDIEVGE